MLTQLAKKAPRRINVVCLIGGTGFRETCKQMKTAVIVVASPGRAVHGMIDGMLRVSRVSLFVLDEADQLVENMKVCSIPTKPSVR